MDKTDYMQQYKQITQKISKKRFLRKPNVAEAAEQFQSISKNLTRQECPSYGAFFELAKARCEHTLANSAGETDALTEAARLFFQSELSYKAIKCPTYDENLNASINCYAHAVRVHIENRQTAHAAALCSELGSNLERVGKTEEAVNHYLRAAELQVLNPIDRLQALRKVADCKLKLKEYEGTLNILADITTVALEYGCTSSGPDGNRKRPIGFYHDLCAQAELEQTLLLIILRPIPSRLSTEHSALLEKYSWELDLDALDPLSMGGSNDSVSGAANGSINTFLLLEDFLLLQSIVMASQSKDFSSLKSLQAEAFARWKPQQNELMYIICQRKQGDGYGGGLFYGL